MYEATKEICMLKGKTFQSPPNGGVLLRVLHELCVTLRVNEGDPATSAGMRGVYA